MELTAGAASSSVSLVMSTDGHTGGGGGLMMAKGGARVRGGERLGSRGRRGARRGGEKFGGGSGGGWLGSRGRRGRLRGWLGERWWDGAPIGRKWNTPGRLGSLYSPGRNGRRDRLLS